MAGPTHYAKAVIPKELLESLLNSFKDYSMQLLNAAPMNSYIDVGDDMGGSGLSKSFHAGSSYTIGNIVLDEQGQTITLTARDIEGTITGTWWDTYVLLNVLVRVTQTFTGPLTIDISSLVSTI